MHFKGNQIAFSDGAQIGGRNKSNKKSPPAAHSDRLLRNEAIIERRKKERKTREQQVDLILVPVRYCAAGTGIIWFAAYARTRSRCLGLLDAQ